MKVLLISTDRALLGEQTSTGDAVMRHRAYARAVTELHIIVFSRSGFKTKQLAHNLFCYPTNSFNYFFYFFDALKIARQLFSRSAPDLIVCQDPFLTALTGYFIKRFSKAKLLLHFHGDFWGNPYWLKEHPLNFLLLLISKFTVRQADALRVVCAPIKRKLIRRGIPASKIKVIPTPVDLSKFNIPNNDIVSGLRRQFNGKKIILWVGRLSPEKNLPFLISSFKRLVAVYPSVVLLLVGQGKEFPKISTLVNSLKMNEHIKFIGHVNYSKLVNYYHAADLFVLPSLHESFGKVLLEAAASAKPVVASKTAGASSIVKDKVTGFLVPINNQKQLLNKILKLLKNDDFARHLGTCAYEDVRHNFDYSKTVNKITNYWQEIYSTS